MFRGDFFSACYLAWQQSSQYKSKNGGMCMSAGAQTLGIRLGGTSYYHGQRTTSVILGKGVQVTAKDIPNSIKLVKRSAYTFVAIILLIGVITQIAEL
ncbi:cobalamin biosynthesis protein [Paraglaciecola aquimarina]|uniref:Cobalamin biosynthesis protein n=1 Tax=Paraglaciecola aquimarina TaxID=1235557 RepID=A0ABU3T131_9ALTE|nr:cobalamin biosynthesis protein [Paraglaciecola aquimarina]MDU0355971.1 cobalamin biosynthesis protein [Paraglaciecola aquimarina]